MDIITSDDDDGEKFLTGPTFNLDPKVENASHQDMLSEVSAWIPSEAQELAELENRRLASIEAQKVLDNVEAEAKALASKKRITDFEQVSKALEISEGAKEEIRYRQTIFDEQFSEIRSKLGNRNIPVPVIATSTAGKLKQVISRLKFW